MQTTVHTLGTNLSKESCLSAALMQSLDADGGNEKSKQESPFDEVTPSANRISKSEGS